ncbi:MAG: hypothetical protein R3C49_00685 [Planctomycetaceae bacterium]
MIEEIIYTSAPKGLKQGSRGFCTVVSTAGMGANLAERLESMSGYRHHFPLHDPQASLNPVNYAHVTTRMAGEKLHVISRICNAGQDYTGRTNKLAHHLVIDRPQTLPAGPARVLADPSVMVSTWDGQVATIAPRTLQNPTAPTPVRLSAWKKVTGDGGWAGSVAEQLLSSKAPIHIIYPPGVDTQPLLIEVLDLIPVSQRWNITFSTYFTRLLPGTECQLRFVLDGTAEATALRNDARAFRIDLCAAPPPAATGGALVAMARTGIVKPEETAQREVASKAADPVRAGVSDRELENMLEDDAVDRALAGSAVPQLPGDDGIPVIQVRRSSRVEGALQRSSRQSSAMLIAGMFMVLILIVVGTWFVFRNAPQDPEVVAAKVTAANIRTDREGDRSKPLTDDGSPEQGSDQDAGTDPASEKPSKTTAETAKPEMVPEVVRKPDPFAERKAFDDLRSAMKVGAERCVWELPPSDRQGSPEQYSVFLLDARSLQIDAGSGSVNLRQTEVTPSQCRWELQVDGTAVGNLELKCSQSETPGRLSWSWNKTAADTTDALSAEARAVRAVNGIVLKLKVDQDGNYDRRDSLNIHIANAVRSPFRWLKLANSNISDTLNVPIPGDTDDTGRPRLTSDELLIEAPAPADVQLSLLKDFNRLLPTNEAYLRQKSQASGQWDLGLVQKGEDPSAAGDSFGLYQVVEKSPGLQALSFKWRSNVHPEDAQPLQWSPLVVRVGDQRVTVFPRGPEFRDPESLIELGQADRAVFPQLKFQILPFELNLQDASVWFRVSVSSEQQTITKEFQAIADKTNFETVGGFELVSPLKLQQETDKLKKDGLGTVLLKVRPFDKDRGQKMVPEAVELVAVASFNLAQKFSVTELVLPDPLGEPFWKQEKDDKEPQFMPGKYRDAADKLVKRLNDEFTGVVADEHRLKLEQLKRFGDVQDDSSRVDRHLLSLLNRLELAHEADEARLSGHLAFTKEIIQAVKKVRSHPDVMKSFQEQKDALTRLEQRYSDEQRDQDKQTIQQLREQLSELHGGVDIFLKLTDDDGTEIRLFVVKSR